MSENAFIHKELFRTICDECIGMGTSREVWSSPVLPNSVIKIEDNSRSFQNAVEWEVWNYVKGTIFERWFAPCEWISPNGAVLIMAKTTRPRKYPDKLPVFLSDTQKNNYGMCGKRFVCHDYGTNSSTLMTFGLTKRMRNARWRDA